MEGTAWANKWSHELVWWGTGDFMPLRRLGDKAGHGRWGQSCREDF